VQVARSRRSSFLQKSTPTNQLQVLISTHFVLRQRYTNFIEQATDIAVFLRDITTMKFTLAATSLFFAYASAFAPAAFVQTSIVRSAPPSTALA
jgi:hypothetical protein